MRRGNADEDDSRATKMTFADRSSSLEIEPFREAARAGLRDFIDAAQRESAPIGQLQASRVDAGGSSLQHEAGDLGIAVIRQARRRDRSNAAPAS